MLSLPFAHTGCLNHRSLLGVAGWRIERARFMPPEGAVGIPEATVMNSRLLWVRGLLSPF